MSFKTNITRILSTLTPKSVLLLLLQLLLVSSVHFHITAVEYGPAYTCPFLSTSSFPAGRGEFSLRALLSSGFEALKIIFH